MPFFGRVALSMLFSIKNCTCMQILVTSSKNADMLLIPPVRNWTINRVEGRWGPWGKISKWDLSTFFKSNLMFLKMFKTVPKTEIKIFTQGPKVWRLEVHRQKSRKNMKIKFLIAYVFFQINSIDGWKTLGLLLFEGYLVLGC